jgi:hypothetical protein
MNHDQVKRRIEKADGNANQDPAAEEREDTMSNDIEHTPTDKSGDETQRNEQDSTEEGVEIRPRKRS